MWGGGGGGSLGIEPKYATVIVNRIVFSKKLSFPREPSDKLTPGNYSDPPFGNSLLFASMEIFMYSKNINFEIF